MRRQERKDIALHMSLNESVSDKNICCYTGISERAMKRLRKTFRDTFESVFQEISIDSLSLTHFKFSNTLFALI
jgi:hypothetical protein